MRLDKFLQVSRLIKRRTVANQVCSRGQVQVNGQPAKASRELKEGDVLTIDLRSRGQIVCEVLRVPAGNVRKDQAESLYRILSRDPEGGSRKVGAGR